MRNRKTIVLLLLAIAAVAGALITLRLRDGGVRQATRASIIEIPEDPARIVLMRRGEQDTVLENGGGRWRLVEPYAGSADEQAVMRFLDAFAVPVTDAVPASELLARGKTPSDYSLDEPVVRVSVTSRAGREDVVSISRPTPTADGVYAAVEGVAAVFVVPSALLESIDVPAEAFRRRSLFRFGPDSVAAFDVKRGTESILEFARDGEGWRLRDGLASASRVRQFLTEVTSAGALDFIWPVGVSNEAAHVSTSLLVGYGLDPDAAVTVSLKCFDGGIHQVSFGKESADGAVYALAQNGSAIVTVTAALRETACQDAMAFSDSRLFPTEGKSVTALSLTDGDVLYALARDAAGGWSLEAPIVAPADTEEVEALLSRILNLTPADLSSPGVGVALTTNAAAVTVARSCVFGAHGAEALRSRVMLDIDPSGVRRLVRTLAGEAERPVAVTYARDRRAWNVESAAEGATADAEGVERTLAAVHPLKALRVERLKATAAELERYGLAMPWMTLGVDQERENAVRRNILVGGTAEGGRYATVGSADAVFVIADEVVEALSSPLVTAPGQANP